MAEFQDVMRQLGRICSTNFGECDICDLRSFCPARTFLDKYVKSGRTKRLEEMVLSWAAEHPEPVYETWYEFLRRNGIIPDVLEDCGDFYESVGRWLVRTRIERDMAECLGSQQKEG